MEGYAVDGLVASAEAVAPRLGAPVSGLAGLACGLAAAGGLSFDEVGRQVAEGAGSCCARSSSM